METATSGIVLDKILVGAITGNFFIPSYQRGYRWGADEVTRLLDDIYTNKEKNYCLQPIVVKKTEGKYELIDGQQRLTTLFILLHYIKKEYKPRIVINYSLSYQLDKGLETYLSDIKEDLAESNIDYFHIYQAYKTIDAWFNKQENSVVAADDMYGYLFKYIHIIWYEIPENSNDAIGLFTRLNIGKIPLTSAELVKAMFLINTDIGPSEKHRELRKRLLDAKQNEIATQWDAIERDLHDKSLWGFLTNNEQKRYPTRIDLILDLIAEKPANCREKYYTFFYFDALRSKHSLEKVWQNIHHTFLILKAWHEDHDLYHKIGYLIASNANFSLCDIYKLSQEKTKTDFNSALDDEIRKSIAIKGNYAEQNYNSATGRERITRLLLLFNVMSVYKIDKQTQRFPFHQYKSFTSGNVTWSLEHIHAQHSEGLKDLAQWHSWLENHLPSVKTVDAQNTALITDMEAAIANARLSKEEFNALHGRVVEVLSARGDFSIHTIANLALLNTADNAALNNATFDVKRNEIIAMDKEGKYIPFCTKMVFLKYYTPSDRNQLHFWGKEDRRAYVENINRVLKSYLGDNEIYIDDAPDDETT